MLIPEGRLEAPDIEKFEKSIQERILNGDLNIIIDFGKVEAIDTAGLRSLLGIAAKLVIKHGRLVLCGLGNNVLALFRVTSSDQVMEVVDTCEEAVESFRQL